MIMQDLLSPKQVAQALKVSESSVKRWCDKGSIATTYTDGGHRRIRLSDLAGFVRQNSLPILDFGPIGFQNGSRFVEGSESAQNLFRDAILEGDERLCTQIVMQLYFAKQPISLICDHVIAKTFHEIGELWACGNAEIYQERRGCRIAHRILTRLSSVVADPGPSSPLAIGCTAEGDNYSLGSMMAELVLMEEGWQAHALGENLPLSSLSAAIQKQEPSLVWVSCSHIIERSEFVEKFRELVATYSQKVEFVIGGRALDECLLSQLPPVRHCKSMTELQSYASELRQSTSN